MIALLLALLASSAQAQENPGRLTGMWRAHIQILDGEVKTFPEAVDGEEHLWARQLWVFDDRSLTIAAQLADHPSAHAAKGVDTRRTTWCQAQVTVPLVWVQGRDAQLPPAVHAQAGGVRSAPKAPLEMSCGVDLPLGYLAQVRNGPGMPRDAVTLTSPDERIVYVLVPDGEAASLERFVQGD